MLGWIIVGFVWIMVAIILEIHCWYIKKYQRWNWNKRQESLLSFSNKQFLLMRWLWPMTLIVVLLFMLFFFMFNNSIGEK